MIEKVSNEYLRVLSNSDFDAEARRILGDEEYTKLVKKIAHREAIIKAIETKQKTTICHQPKQETLFGEYIDGKTAAAGPDR